MKKIIFALFAVGMVACTPSAPKTDGTTPVDSNAVVVLPPQDTVAPDSIVLGSTDTTTIANPDVAVDKGTQVTTGRQANPKIDLNAKTFSVSGHILVAGSYCGGAAPTQPILDEAKRPKPFANQGFLIREGKMNALGTPMVTRTRTDANGDFKLQLRPGSYCMVLEEKESARAKGFFTEEYIQVDKACDSKWLNTCDLSFTVADKNVSGLRVTFNKKCFLTSLSPCVSWNGPLPPAAAPRGGK